MDIGWLPDPLYGVYPHFLWVMVLLNLLVAPVLSYGALMALLMFLAMPTFLCAYIFINRAAYKGCSI